MYIFILTARRFEPKKCKSSLKKFDFMQFWNCMLAATNRNCLRFAMDGNSCRQGCTFQIFYRSFISFMKSFCIFAHE